MALQHFYSRVPARVSMYNRADGFDTFAQSAGLEREFVERELASVYENKLNKNDVTVIRRNEMPCVYTQCCTRSGALVQNCISYLPLDYTGERSAYLSHSLIYSTEEKREILSSHEENILHPELFVTNISRFDLTSPDAAPDPSYPQTTYEPCPVGEYVSLVRDVDPETARSFLYAVLYAICGKGRNVFFRLSGQNDELSRKSVRLFNEVLSILPYQLRGNLSFASYVTDASMYANYKLKGVSAHFPEGAASKFVYFDLQTNLITGVQHDEVVANKPLVQFFYSLLENKTLRKDFLRYMDRAAAAIPSLQNLNMKVLTSLVFLFQCSSGLFVQQEILPNDAMVYEYLCAYEKYRVALSEEYRMQAYKCLLRYPQNHQAIPKNIFAKVSRLYGAESYSVKRIVMNIVLELIHTDVMRDKLFTFIRNSYRTEEADMKQIIITDLSRVFYGGFLQNQLLAFFSEQFAEEPETSRSLILEKLLLSIRTPAVQKKIIAFIDQHYNCLSESQKDHFYNTFIEMLPECDALSDMLIQMVNKNFESETEERRADLAQQLVSILESDCRRKERSLMPLMANNSGFSRDLVIKQVFGPWSAWKVHTDYIALLGEKTVIEKTETLIRVFELVPNPNLDSLLTEAISLYQNDLENGDLYLWLNIAEQVQSMPEEFANQLHTAVIESAVSRRLCDVFDMSHGADGMTLMENYAASHPNMRESEQYSLIDSFNRMVSAGKRLDYSEVERQLSLLVKDTDGLPQMAEYLKECEIDPGKQAEEAVLCLEILQGLLKDGSADLGKLFRKRLGNHTAEQAMILLLSVCGPMSEAGPMLLSALTAPGSGIKEVVALFVNAYGKGAYHRLRSELPQGTSFGAQLEETITEHKKANGSFLSKLFGKK